MLSACYSVSGRNDVIYPPKFEEGKFSEVQACRRGPGSLPTRGSGLFDALPRPATPRTAQGLPHLVRVHNTPQYADPLRRALALLPLFTQPRRRGILRTSPVRSSPKFAQLGRALPRAKIRKSQKSRTSTQKFIADSSPSAVMRARRYYVLS
jgi:hypothetical protein